MRTIENQEQLLSSQSPQQEWRGMGYSVQPMPSNVSIYLIGELGSAEKYTDAFEILRNAQAGSRVTIYINGPGGHADTCIQFINAIRDSKATVVGVLDGIAMSAHAIILMACHVVMVHPFTQFMAHHASFASWDQGEKTVESAIIKEKWLFEMVSAYYGPLLTDEELAELRSGVRDTYFSSDEMGQRLNHWGVGEQASDGTYVFTRFDVMGYTDAQKAEYIASKCPNGHCSVEESDEPSESAKSLAESIKGIFGGDK